MARAPLINSAVARKTAGAIGDALAAIDARWLDAMNAHLAGDDDQFYAAMIAIGVSRAKAQRAADLLSQGRHEDAFKSLGIHY